MQGLMLDTPGSHSVSWEELVRVPVPEKTGSYTPVAYHELVEEVREKLVARTGMSVLNESYGLARKGQRFFGTITMDSDTDGDGRAMMAGLRASHDMSMSVALATGESVFVCSNMCFSGDAMVLMRRHTKNVWETLRGTIVEAIDKAQFAYDDMENQIRQMQTVEVPEDEGYRVLGLMHGHRAISSRQLGVAVGDWRTPRHEEFADRNLWSLYNCITEGLKKTAAGQMLTTHTRAHDWFTDTMGIHRNPRLAVLQDA